MAVSIQITIKHKHTGLEKKVGHMEFANQIDKDDWLEVGSKATNSKAPSSSWSIKDIKSWMDSNQVEYTGSHNSKAKLLALVDA